MLVVFYIVLALLQLSFGQDLTENEVDTQEVGMVLISHTIVQEDLIPIEPQPTIEPTFIEDVAPTIGDVIKPVDIPFSDENDKVEDIEDVKELLTIGDPILFSDEIVMDDAERSKKSMFIVDAVSFSDDNDEGENTEELKEPLIFGGIVKAQGKITIATRYGYDGNYVNNNGPISNEEVVEVIEEPISFSGCVKAQGKVTIAEHSCDDNNKNFVENIESKAIIIDEDIPDSHLSFAGPVHAQGKISIGTHYGCCGPIRIPPTMLPYQPLPYFASFMYPPLYYPAHSLPGSFLAQNPFSMPETEPFISPVFQESATNSGSFEDLPVASNLANSMPDGSGADNQHGMAFNGVVPACGTVSIAARF